MASTSNMFVARALQKLLSEREMKRSPHVKLKTALEAALKATNTSSSEPSNESNKASSSQAGLLSVILLCCETQSPKIVVTALDCLEKILAYSNIGQTPLESHPDIPPINALVETVTKCFQGETTDDAVSLQILKCLLTAVTATKCEVHGDALLAAIDTCHAIYLFSKGPINQITAKATLNQMLNAVFARLEANPTILVPDHTKTIHEQAEDDVTKEEAVSSPVSSNLTNGVDNVSAPATPSTSQSDLSAGVDNENTKGNEKEVVPVPLMAAQKDALTDDSNETKDTTKSEREVHTNEHEQVSVETQQQSSSPSPPDSPVNPVTNDVPEPSVQPMEGVDHTVSIDTQTLQDGSEVGGILLIPADGRRHSNASTTRLGGSERRASLAMAGSMGIHGEGSYEGMDALKARNAFVGEDVTAGMFSHPSHHDAFIVFRRLNKLTMTHLKTSAANVPVDLRSNDIRSKILSLELVLNILQNSGTVMQTHEAFITLIKHELCISLSKNGVSTVPQVFELSLAIFLILLAYFKVYLKAQIEIFFRDIFLLILETSASTFAQRWLVLQAISRICGDAQLLVDIYVNYDCDIALDNVFHRMIIDISRIAQGGHITDLGGSGSSSQELSLKKKGLECLVVALTSMTEWMQSAPATTEDLTPSAMASLNASMSPLQNVANGSYPSSPRASAITYGSDASPLPHCSYDKLDFESLKKHKDVMENCIALFNMNCKKGILMAQEKGLFGSSPADAAAWLKGENRLSKLMIGELLGEVNKPGIDIMYAYVESLNFKGLDFVSALRHFLSGFRLPGEAQKIDRLMEKFSEKFFQDNPAFPYFANADTAYVLAFSIIMLTTDLHSTSIKKKMTMEEFVRNNRGINDSKDLPIEYLESIYQEISRQGIKVKEDMTTRPNSMATSLVKDAARRVSLYHQQMTQRSEAVQALLHDNTDNISAFTLATRTDHVKFMFSIAWTSCLAAFSVQLKESSDAHTTFVCLRGFHHAIYISALFGMELERHAFVQSFTKFTNLQNRKAVLSPKDLECFKALIQTAQASGNHLQSSWYQVLKSISLIEYMSADGMESSGTAEEPEDVALKSKQSMPSLGTESFTLLPSMNIIGSNTNGREALLQAIEESSMTDKPVTLNDLIMSRDGSKSLAYLKNEWDHHEDDKKEQGVLLAIDQIFTGSKGLSGDAILEFVQCLCKVALEELQSPGKPRMYSLQKIVEISYYNMDRIRLEWSRIWNVLGDLFNKVGTLPNLEIAMFAVDSLRQLSMKFIERGELANFHFQKDFLKPFEYIMAHTQIEIQDMVVRCMSQMLQSQRSSIRSGWKNIFSVFSMASSLESANVVSLAFESTKSVVRESFDLFYETASVDAINCLTEFACNTQYHDIALESLDYIKRFARVVEHTYNEDEGAEDNRWVKGWFPILFGLHRVINRCTMDVQARALTVLFEIVQDRGKLFTFENWQDLFRVVFRLFDDLRLPEDFSERNVWLQTTCNQTIFALVGVFGQHFSTIKSMLPQFFDILDWCIMQNNEQLARSATQCIQVLVLSNGYQFNKEDWDNTFKGIARMFASSTPNELWSFPTKPQESPESQPTLDFHAIIIKCVVQLEIIQTIENIILQESDMTDHMLTREESESTTWQKITAVVVPVSEGQPKGMYQYLDGEHMRTMLDCLKESHEFAKKFNANNDLRVALWKAGFMKQLPNLLKQETTSLHASLGILFRVYADGQKRDLWLDVESRLLMFTLTVMDLFPVLQSERQRDIWSPVLCLILTKVLTFSDDKFFRHISKCYNALCQLLGCEMRLSVRILVRDVLLRVGERFSITSTPVSV